MNPPVLSVVYGIGGRDFSLVDARKVFAMAEHGSSFGAEPVMYGVKA
jgi:hypothetical protein